MRNNPQRIYPLPDDIVKSKSTDTKLIEKAIEEYDIKVWKGRHHTQGSFNLRSRLYNYSYCIRDLLWANYSKYSDDELIYISEFYAVAIKDDKLAQKQLEERKYELWHKVEEKRNLVFWQLKNSLVYLPPMEIVNRTEELQGIVKECFHWLRVGSKANGTYENGAEFDKTWRRAYEIWNILLKYIPLNGLVAYDLYFPGQYYAILTYGNENDNNRIDVELGKIASEDKKRRLEQSGRHKKYTNNSKQEHNIANVNINGNHQGVTLVLKRNTVDKCQAAQQTKIPVEDLIPLSLTTKIKTAAEPLTFRGLPIQWEHENVGADNALDEEEQSGNAHHRILWGDGKYKRDNFFRAIWGADYKKVREKVIFKGAAADNVLRLTTGQRTALEYDALYHRHIDKLVFVDEQDEKELFAFFASDDCSTAKETLRRLNLVDGAKKVATFGAGRQQPGAAEFTWCYTKEAVKGGNRYRGVALDWSLWASGIEQAYNNYLSDKSAKLWDKVRPAMYCQYQRGEVCRMTYAAEDYQ